MPRQEKVTMRCRRFRGALLGNPGSKGRECPGRPSSEECPPPNPRIYRPSSSLMMYSFAVLTAVAASPDPAVMRRTLPGYVTMSPAA